KGFELCFIEERSLLRPLTDHGLNETLLAKSTDPHEQRPIDVRWCRLSALRPIRVPQKNGAARTCGQASECGKASGRKKQSGKTRSRPNCQTRTGCLGLNHIRNGVQPTYLGGEGLNPTCKILNRIGIDPRDLDSLVVQVRPSRTISATSKSRTVSMSMLSVGCIMNGMAGARKKPLARSRKSRVRIR